MIDLSVIAAGAPILLGAAIGLAARRGLRVLDGKRAGSTTPRPTPANARAAR